MDSKTFVNPEFSDIDIFVSLTTAAEEVSAVSFIDNTDDEEFDEETLTAEQRGMVFRYQRMPAGRVLVSMPFTVITAEVAKGLYGMSSFVAEQPFNPNIPSVAERLRRFWGVAFSRFSLENREFERLMDYGSRHDWVFHKGIVSYSHLSGALAAACAQVVHIHTAFQTLRTEVLNAVSLTDDEFSSVCQRIDDIRNDIGELDNSATVAEAVAAKQYSTSGENVALSMQIDKLAMLTTTAHALDTAALAKVASGKNKKQFVDRSLNELLGINLAGELGRLQQTFPALSIVRAISDNKIEIRLGSGVVTFDGSVFTVDGDIGSIAKTTVVTEAPTSFGNRLRSIRPIAASDTGDS